MKIVSECSDCIQLESFDTEDIVTSKKQVPNYVLWKGCCGKFCKIIGKTPAMDPTANCTFKGNPSHVMCFL